MEQLFSSRTGTYPGPSVRVVILHTWHREADPDRCTPLSCVVIRTPQSRVLDWTPYEIPELVSRKVGSTFPKRCYINVSINVSISFNSPQSSLTWTAKRCSFQCSLRWANCTDCRRTASLVPVNVNWLIWGMHTTSANHLGLTLILYWRLYKVLQYK